MKRSILFLFVVLIFGCSDKEIVGINNSDEFKISVIKDGLPCKEAKVMCLFSETEEVIVSCNENGIAIVNSEKPIKEVVAMAPGFSGLKKMTSEEREIVVRLESADLQNRLLKNLTVVSQRSWVVFQTISGGDVIFKYKGIKVSFDCIKYLPNLGDGVNSPNPNYWGGWYLTDYLPIWDGWKLLVPRRYQYYHSIVYLQPISLSLRLIANDY